MSHRDPERGEPDLDDLLRVLAHDDAQAKAPAHIRDAVLAAWDAQRAAGRTRRGMWTGPTAGPSEDRAWFTYRPGIAAAAAALMIAVSGLVGYLAVDRVVDRPPADVDTRSYFAPTGDAMMTTLVGEPALDTETLQLVRVRMPRGALRAFGVALLEPDATGDVEVDVLVGDDGFPRSIQRVRPMPVAEERQP